MGLCQTNCRPSKILKKLEVTFTNILHSNSMNYICRHGPSYPCPFLVLPSCCCHGPSYPCPFLVLPSCCCHGPSYPCPFLVLPSCCRHGPSYHHHRVPVS